MGLKAPTETSSLLQNDVDDIAKTKSNTVTRIRFQSVLIIFVTAFLGYALLNTTLERTISKLMSSSHSSSLCLLGTSPFGFTDDVRVVTTRMDDLKEVRMGCWRECHGENM